MNSSPLEPPDAAVATAVRIAERLSETEVLSAQMCGGGGNNRVYRIRTREGAYALKSYGPAETDRDRLAQEFDGLRFLGACGIGGVVPRAYAVDRDERYALYEWIDGSVAADHGPVDIARALAVMGALHRARHAPGSGALAPATEAVLRPQDLANQIGRRIDRLGAVTASEPELAEFLEDELEPEFRRRFAKLGDRDVSQPLPNPARTLSASDFGFHNALRRGDGSLVFIDFEYFGWDDPAKLTSDFLLHPGMSLAPAERADFLNGALALYGDEADFRNRLDACFPLYGIRWALIILNEFLPQVWARRRFSGKGGDWNAAKREQLRKSRATLASVRTHEEGRYS